ncbi:ABC transporter permease [Ligilactobacillus equi]
MKTLYPLLKNELILTKRGFQSLIFGIILPIGFLLIFSQVYSTGPRAIVNHYIQQSTISMVTYSGLCFCLFTFPYSLKDDETNNRKRTLLHTPVPQWQYYFVKIIRVLVSYLLAIILTFGVSHYYLGINLPLGKWVVSGLLLLLGVSCFFVLGYLLSFIKSTELLSTVCNITYLSLAMLGGLWIPLSEFPKTLRRVLQYLPSAQLWKLVTNYLDNGKITINSIAILGINVLLFSILVVIVSKFRKKDL